MNCSKASSSTWMTLTLCLAFWIAATSCPTFAATPNIIVMMADDMGMGDTSAYQDFTGNADSVQLHTPNMERLACMGVRFTDAHTPTSRCSGTRYGLLTGRYPWRNRLKHWVLFGAQGDPMIESDRPTIASMLRDEGYHTAIVGKWHVGLRYRQASGLPAAEWRDADLTQPLHTCPLDHGFDFSRITSRSHGTSGPDAGDPIHPKNNGPNKRGPGHLHGRKAIGATTGRQLVMSGPSAYVLSELGGRHSDSAMAFLQNHVSDRQTKQRPFFLYYASNSNHGPYTPDSDIAGKPVTGAARTKLGAKMDARHDFIYENDVALGRLIDWLENEFDPRHPGQKLMENTLVIFTSDNGAEIKSKVATGPFRSKKGSAYEGGHRVPFIAAWPNGSVGDADPNTAGQTNSSLIALQDLYATFADVVGAMLPDLRNGLKGAEDSRSVLAAFHGETLNCTVPLFHSDHNEAKQDHAACAVRFDVRSESGRLPPGKWKLLFDAALIRQGKATRPRELYNLADDPMEQHNLIKSTQHASFITFLAELATRHRNAGGQRLVRFAQQEQVVFDWTDTSLAKRFAKGNDQSVTTEDLAITAQITGAARDGHFCCDEIGLGISGNASDQVDDNESLKLSFDKDVIIESCSLVAEGGRCGGFYRVGNGSPLAIYCVDGDNDAQDQSGVLSDIGTLKAGQIFELNSSPHYGVEAAGKWRLRSLTVRPF